MILNSSKLIKDNLSRHYFEYWSDEAVRILLSEVGVKVEMEVQSFFRESFVAPNLGLLFVVKNINVCSEVWTE